MPRLPVHLTPQAIAGWHRFAAAHGVSLTALVEILGRRLGELTETERFPDIMRSVLRDARDLSAERRRRSKED